MANTFTTNYTLTKSEIGANNDNWGNDLNTALDTVDTQIVRKLDKADLVDQTSQNISFTTSNEIQSSTTNLFQNYRAGDKIRISGASSGGNNALHTISSKTNGQTLVVSTSLTQESAGATITYRLVPHIDEVDIDGGTINGATIAESDVTVGSGKTLNVAAGTLTLAAGQIATAALADDAVTTAKITDANVTTAKLANDGVTYAKMQDTTTANRVLGAASAGEVGEVQVATAMIADDAVTYAKMQDTATNNRVLGAATAGTVGEVQVATAMVADDAITYAKMQDTSAGNVLLGTNDSGAATIEELTKANVLSMLNVEDGANAYSLPTAAANTLGGVKVCDRLSIDTGVLSADVQTVGTGQISNDAVTYAKIQNVASANTVLGSTSAGGVVSELSGATVTGLLSTFSTSAKGVVPAASGTGEDEKFLKGDGTWAVAGGVAHLLNATANNTSATLDINLSSYSYDHYKIVIKHLVPATDNAGFDILLGTSSSSFATSGYLLVGGMLYYTGSGSVQSPEYTRTAVLTDVTNIGSDAAGGVHAELNLFDLHSTSFYTTAEFTATEYDVTDGDINRWVTSSARTAATNDAYVRISCTSGNIKAGKISVYAMVT